MADPTPDTPQDATSDFAAPTGPKLSRELQSVREIPRLVRRAPSLIRGPRGDQTVMAFPGWSTSDLFLAPLRSGLRTLGHSTHGWGFGINTGEVEGLLPSVANSVAHLVAQKGAPITLIGWSLGGVFAREIARDRPELVQQVITLATPVWGGPKYTRGVNCYSEEYVKNLEERVNERNMIPLQRPVTALYSKADAIVDWRACIDDFSPNVKNIEVQSTHVGITIDPDVWKIIAELLAAPPTRGKATNETFVKA